ncbi:MAG: 2-dehydropantoate 2-reductase [Candidatus Omnitrophica bacterium]|nr:2-dehydropantoate 2-reductase [Candidatus Omnitrophota bacterium]
MKIVIIGAGAIGGLAAGYLKIKGEDVSLVGHADAVEAIKNEGLRIQGLRGNFSIEIDASHQINSQAQLIILATKTQDIEAALRENKNFLQDTAVLTTQNGVRADNMVAKHVPKENIISSIVMFGATSLEPGKIVHNFEGHWIISGLLKGNDAKVVQISQVLEKIFPVIIAEDLKGMKYLKIFVNANNCLPAILGESMQEVFSDLEVSRISIAIWKEGLQIINKAGINLTSLPDFPLERITKLTSLPTVQAASILAGIMTNLSKEPVYGSILQSIKRGRPSEIDYINGEFVNLAEEQNLDAPLNKKLVQMVHQVERSKRFFTKEELISNTRGLLN